MGYVDKVSMNGTEYDMQDSKLSDLIVDTVFSGTYSGTTWSKVSCALPAGTYVVHIDSIESSDTDDVVSRFNFIYGDNQELLFFNNRRGIEINKVVVLTREITHVGMYASYSWPASQGDTYSFHGVKIWRLTDEANSVIRASSAIAPSDRSPALFAHAKDSLFTMNGSLYGASAAIAKGEAIVPGTNATETNIAKLFTPVTLTASSGDITSIDTTYATLGTTDARLYVYPFGLAILKGYFRITQDPGSTERVFANISVAPLHWFGQTAISQQGTTCAFFIRPNGNIGVTSTTGNSLGMYHFIVAFPTTPYIQ